jgi:hypothetical protein
MASSGTFAGSRKSSLRTTQVAQLSRLDGSEAIFFPEEPPVIGRVKPQRLHPSQRLACIDQRARRILSSDHVVNHQPWIEGGNLRRIGACSHVNSVIDDHAQWRSGAGSSGEIFERMHCDARAERFEASHRRQVDARRVCDSTNANSFTQFVSHSPFPASLNIEPVETRWASAYASGPPPTVRDISIVVEEESLAHLRRDFEAQDIRLMISLIRRSLSGYFEVVVPASRFTGLP